MKYISQNSLIILTIVAIFSLIGCGGGTFEEPENSLRSRIDGAAFGIALEIQNEQSKDIEFKEEELSKELEEYIVKNVPDYKENRYLIQLEETTGIRWIDFKKKKTKIYYPPSENGYTHIGSVLNSPNGEYIALNITKGFSSPWSELLIINVNDNTYAKPLTDEVLLTPPDGSQCSGVEIIEKRTEENRTNECVAEAPSSMYMIDYWSSNQTVELIKQFPSSTIIYSIAVK